MKLIELTIFSFCALIVVFVLAAFAQTDEHMDANSEPRDILIADHLHKHWLTIGRVNHKQPDGEFDPNWTYIRTQNGIVPVIKQHGESYQITFTSEVTKDLP